MFARKFLLFLILAAISIAFSWLREPGVDKGFIIGFLGYLFFAIICFSVFRKSLGSFFIIIILVGGSAFKGLNFFTESSHYFTKALPDIIANLLGALTGISFYVLKGSKKYWLPLISLIYIFLLWGFGYQAWMQKMNYGNYRSEVNLVTPGFSFLNENGQQLTNKDFKDKIVIFYFWKKKCKLCYEDFPKLQELYNQYKYDTRVEIYAINSEVTFNEVKKELAFYGYQFDIIYGSNDSFDILWYPTTLILDQQGTTVYKGRLKGAESIIEKLKI